MPLRAVIYTRVSRDEQVRNFSLATQLAACQQYANSHDMHVVAELADDETGATLDRTGLKELLHLVTTRQVDAVIVYSVDRLHRDLINQVLVRRDIQKAGVAIHYVRRGELKDTPEDRFTDNIEAAVAEYERERIRERTMRGTKGKVESGKVPGGGLPKYGYTYKGERRDRELVIDPVQAAIVKEICERYYNGDTVRQLQVDLTERGVPTWADLYGRRNRKKRQPGEWDQGTIYDILHDEAYAGTYQAFQTRQHNEKQQGRSPDEWIGVPCPAIISREMWEQNQRRLKQGRKTSPRSMRRFYLLRGRMRCGVCGGAIVGATQQRPSGHEHRYYKCVNMHKKTATECSLPYIQGDKIDDGAWVIVRELFTDRERVEYAIRMLQEQQHESQQTVIDERAELERQRDIVQRQIDTLLASIAKISIIDPRDIERQIAPLYAQRNDIERKIHALVDAPVTPLPPIVNLVLTRYDALAQGIREADADKHERLRVVELLDVQVTVVIEKPYMKALIYTPLQAEPGTCILRDDLV